MRPSPPRAAETGDLRPVCGPNSRPANTLGPKLQWAKIRRASDSFVTQGNFHSQFVHAGTFANHANRRNPTENAPRSDRANCVTLLYYDPRFLDHETGKHPERPERLRAVMTQLERTALVDRCRCPEWEDIAEPRALRVHDAAYLDQVRRYASEGGGRIEADTIVSSASFDVANLAAGAVCDAVERIVNGEDRQALCLVRPPGHHALRDSVMGFCLLNNVAIGARMAVDELGLERVLIVDWDVHHGNGTQAEFWTEPRVGFFSMHRYPFYPGTGSAAETGEGDALGTTFNVPVEYGISRKSYVEQFAGSVEEFARRIRPQLVFVSAGFDTHRDDPVGSLGLENEDFAPLTEIVLETAAEYADGRLISVLEGGYNTGALAGSVESHLRTLLDAEEASVN